MYFVVDCTYGPYGNWGDCSGACGTEGQKERTREVLSEAVGGGAPCTDGGKIDRLPCTNDACPGIYKDHFMC